MPRKKPPVEIVSDKLGEIASDVRGGIDLLGRLIGGVTELIDGVRRPGGVKAEIQIGEDGPEVRVRLPNEEDHGDRAQVPHTAEQPEARRAARPPARRVSRTRPAK
jgi:hypothetical protein